MTVPSEPAERHRAFADRFADLVRGADAAGAWERPSPVTEWTARGVVAHLIDWLPGFLSMGSDVRLPEGPAVDDDPIGAWDARAGAVQAILDDPERASSTFRSRMFGDLPLSSAINQFYTTDIFMHSWDLARATGQPDRLDDDFATELRDGLASMGDVLRASNQFGAEQPVPADADATDRLIAFIGRDPRWRA